MIEIRRLTSLISGYLAVSPERERQQIPDGYIAQVPSTSVSLVDTLNTTENLVAYLVVFTVEQWDEIDGAKAPPRVGGRLGLVRGGKPCKMVWYAPRAWFVHSSVALDLPRMAHRSKLRPGRWPKVVLWYNTRSKYSPIPSRRLRDNDRVTDL
jgi:hypothetical protein